MLELIDDYLASPWWEATTAVAGVLGFVGLGALLLGYARQGWRRRFAWLSLGLLVLTVVFSMVFEEFLPELRRQTPERALEIALGMLGFLLATALFVYGGYRFVRATFAYMTRAETQRDARGRSPAAGLGALLAAWGPGLLWMGGAAVLFALAASLYHESRFPLAWLWGASDS